MVWRQIEVSLSPHERNRIAAEAGVSESTVRRTLTALARDVRWAYATKPRERVVHVLRTWGLL